MHMTYFSAISNPFLRLDTNTDFSGDTSAYIALGSAKWKYFRRRVDEVARAVASHPNTLQVV